MSTFTPEMARASVDNLDIKIREAIQNGNLEKLIAKERSALVSLNFLELFLFLDSY
jgi:hypothetical protein